jgi:hypothetical protein
MLGLQKLEQTRDNYDWIWKLGYATEAGRPANCAAANPTTITASKQQLVYSTKESAIKVLCDGDKMVLHCDRSKHGYEGNLVCVCRNLTQESDEYTKTEEEMRSKHATLEATQKFVLNPEGTLSPAADDTVAVAWVPNKYTAKAKEKREKGLAAFDEEAGWEMEMEAKAAPVAAGEVQDALEIPV